MSKYSNARAMRALIKASLQSIFKSPSAIFFSLAFPLIFILVFGFLGGGGGFSVHVASAPGSDTTSMLYKKLHMVSALKWEGMKDTAAITKALQDGDIAATISIHQQPQGTTPKYKIDLNTIPQSMGEAQELQSIIAEVVKGEDPEIQTHINALLKIDTHMSEVNIPKRIDFILPGQLGFSLLAAGVFGTAFVFFNLRQTLVLKRYFATPVRKQTIVISEGIARMVFQLIGAIIIISLGYFAFGFSLAHGFLTFVEMLTVCALGLLVFLGFGIIVSSVAKNESVIPLFANMITMPQLLLSGTFFPIDVFPKWLQPFCKALPLSYLNDALREIANKGASLWDVRIDLLALTIWGIIIYLVAGKIFKWE